MAVFPISQVIPEKNIVVFAPHFDDVLFMLGGYILELREKKLLDTKKFHILLLFPRSNYLARTGDGNRDTSLERQKLATGIRLLEDMDCLDELLGEFNYRYELAGEKECFTRAKAFADSEMEYPCGRYEDFAEDDWAILDRLKTRVGHWAKKQDTALVFPLGIKEHIDHFITREAGIITAREMGVTALATFYFQEDKPYGGLASQEELNRVDTFIKDNKLASEIYRHHPEEVIRLAFKHYTSQVEEVYKKGIRERSNFLSKTVGKNYPCDRMLKFIPI